MSYVNVFALNVRNIASVEMCFQPQKYVNLIFE
jgi:hypothetical protein